MYATFVSLMKCLCLGEKGWELIAEDTEPGVGIPPCQRLLRFLGDYLVGEAYDSIGTDQFALAAPVAIFRLEIYHVIHHGQSTAGANADTQPATIALLSLYQWQLTQYPLSPTATKLHYSLTLVCDLCLIQGIPLPLLRLACWLL